MSTERHPGWEDDVALTAGIESFSGYGFHRQDARRGDVFIMPGPYERADRVALAYAELGARWRLAKMCD
jgi:hypothetical protein